MNGLRTQSRKTDPKIKVKLLHVNKNRKRIFVQTPFSHCTLKLERKQFHAAKPIAFSPHFLFRRDQKSLLHFDFKNHENV